MLEINAVVIYQIKTHYLYYIMVYKGWQRSNFWPQKKIVEITEFKNFCNSHSIWNFFYQSKALCLYHVFEVLNFNKPKFLTAKNESLSINSY
jgi:hypothetical protein